MSLFKHLTISNCYGVCIFCFANNIFLMDNTDIEMNKDIRDKILTKQRLPKQEKEHIVFAIDAMIRDARVRQAYGS